MWVDIMTRKEAQNTPQEDVSPPQPQKWQLRVVVWETKGVPVKDSKSTDIFVIGKPHELKAQSTDVLHLDILPYNVEFRFTFGQKTEKEATTGVWFGILSFQPKFLDGQFR
jgi:hypothetical protein